MATDYFLELDGIKGESTDEKHKDKIEVDSFQWGVTNPTSMARGGGGGAGKADWSDISFGKRMDSASAKLMAAAGSGEHIKKAVVTARKQGGKGNQLDYLIVTLEDVMVSSYSTSGSGDGVPYDSVSLSYAKIKYEYKPQKPDGTLGGSIIAMYDRAANKVG